MYNNIVMQSFSSDKYIFSVSYDDIHNVYDTYEEALDAYLQFIYLTVRASTSSKLFNFIFNVTHKTHGIKLQLQLTANFNLLPKITSSTEVLTQEIKALCEHGVMMQIKVDHFLIPKIKAKLGSKNVMIKSKNLPLSDYLHNIELISSTPSLPTLDVQEETSPKTTPLKEVNLQSDVPIAKKNVKMNNMPEFMRFNKKTADVKSEINKVANIKNVLSNQAVSNNLTNDLSLPEITILKEKYEQENELIKSQIALQNAELCELSHKIAHERKELRLKMEKEESNRKIFEADRNVYHIIAGKIEEGELEESNVPILFAQKFPVFKIMDSEEKLNTDDFESEYLLYKQIYDECYPPTNTGKPSPVKPHNYEYLSPEEKRVYDQQVLEYEYDQEKICIMCDNVECTCSSDLSDDETLEDYFE